MALAVIQEEENRGRELCKVRVLLVYLISVPADTQQTLNTGSNDLILDSWLTVLFQSATEKELEVYCKTREGGAKLSRAAQKLREKASFASQMDLDAAKKGIVKMSKADAKAQARLELKTEMYMHNVQKVKATLQLRGRCGKQNCMRGAIVHGTTPR